MRSTDGGEKTPKQIKPVQVWTGVHFNESTLHILAVVGRIFTICRSSMRAFTPASISFLSWGVSGHGYSVARKLHAGEEANMWLWQETPLIAAD